jgi:hypothetical protein
MSDAYDVVPFFPDIVPDLLTPDEQLIRHEHWQGEARDLPTAIRELAKLHHLASDETIDESEDWYDFVDELAVLIGQLYASR